MDITEPLWVEACTLPTAERPLRLAEFDDLFAVHLRRQARSAPTRLDWTLAPGAEELARDLTQRESSCCSFFDFAVTAGDAGVEVTVRVPEEQVAVLDALEQRAAARIAVPGAIRFASVTLDCPDTERLATFYATITGGTVTNLDEHWATVVSGSGRFDFQRVPGFTPPTWPDPASPVQLHLEFHVEDRDAAERRVLAAGATKFAFQPNSEQCFVYADPAGHPFCLTTWSDMRPPA